MTKRIEDLVNISDTGNDLAPISCNATTATKILDSFDLFSIEPNLKIEIFNSANKLLWVKTQAASVDNNKRGIGVGPGTQRILYAVDAMTSEELSAIYEEAPFGGSGLVYVSFI